jgi:hypothetical protein
VESESGLGSDSDSGPGVESDGGFGFHESNIGRRSAASPADERRAQRAKFFSRESAGD